MDLQYTVASTAAVCCIGCSCMIHRAGLARNGSTAAAPALDTAVLLRQRCCCKLARVGKLLVWTIDDTHHKSPSAFVYVSVGLHHTSITNRIAVRIVYSSPICISHVSYVVPWYSTRNMNSRTRVATTRRALRQFKNARRSKRVGQRGGGSKGRGGGIGRWRREVD